MPRYTDAVAAMEELTLSQEGQHNTPGTETLPVLGSAPLTSRSEASEVKARLVQELSEANRRTFITPDL